MVPGCGFFRWTQRSCERWGEEAFRPTRAVALAGPTPQPRSARHKKPDLEMDDSGRIGSGSSRQCHSSGCPGVDQSSGESSIVAFVQYGHWECSLAFHNIERRRDEELDLHSHTCSSQYRENRTPEGGDDDSARKL